MKSQKTNKTAVFSLLAVSLSCISTAHAQDTMLITDGSGEKVVRFDYLTGTAFDHFVGQGLSDLKTSVFMCLSPIDDIVFVSSSTNNKIMAYDKFTGERHDGDGVFIDDSTHLDHPFGMAFSTKNNSLYISSYENGDILEYNGSTGAYIDTLETGLIHGEGLVITQDSERIYATDFEDFEVYFYDWDSMTSKYVYGGAIDFSSQNIYWPTGLAADSSNNIYVTQRGPAPAHTTGSVLKITPAGAVTYFAGPFVQIRDVTVDFSDNVVVSHIGGISKYNSSGVDQSYTFTAFDGGLAWHNGLLLLDAAVICGDTECEADFNDDGSLNFFDVSAFLNAFSAGCD